MNTKSNYFGVSADVLGQRNGQFKKYLPGFASVASNLSVALKMYIIGRKSHEKGALIDQEDADIVMYFKENFLHHAIAGAEYCLNNPGTLLSVREKDKTFPLRFLAEDPDDFEGIVKVLKGFCVVLNDLQECNAHIGDLLRFSEVLDVYKKATGSYLKHPEADHSLNPEEDYELIRSKH